MNSKRIFFLFIALMSTGWASRLLFSEKRPETVTIEDDESERIVTKKKIKRKIASKDSPFHNTPTPLPQERYRPTIDTNTTVRTSEAADFTDENSEQEVLAGATGEGNYQQENQNSYPASSGRSSYYSPSRGVASTSTPKGLAQSSPSSPGGGTGLVQGPIYPGPSAQPGTPAPPELQHPARKPQDNPLPGNTLSCTASVPAGSYAYVLSVTLSCSSSTTIRYCLGEGTCCDPDSPSGAVYSASTPIIIGDHNAQYCLSYSAVGGTVSQRTYDINKLLPDLYVDTPVTWMQTTEAPMYSNVTSQNFGKANVSLAQISYLSHNIGSTGDNLQCEEVETEMSNYTTPSPLYSLSPFNVDGLTTSQQVEIPLSPANLEYGTNYVATYMKDSSGATPTYACSISEFTLMDFPIFDDSGISSTGELTGGFTSFGFYEDFALPRSPAGESSYKDADQKIESTFMSVIY